MRNALTILGFALGITLLGGLILNIDLIDFFGRLGPEATHFVLRGGADGKDRSVERGTRRD